jgi:anti-sigma factor RsiW
MTSPSIRDMEDLSAYLDGQISQSERTRLEKRIQADPVLAAALQELRQTRALLRRTPQRRAPRNFTLTAKMAGIRAPVPRLVPVFSWASAVAMLLFIFTLGASLVGRLSIGTAAPMLAAAPSGIGGGPPAAATQAPVMAAPAVTAPPAPAPLRKSDQTAQETPTAEAFVMSAPEATPPASISGIQAPSALKAQQKTVNPWLVIWPGLGVLLGILALLVWWLNQRAFQRKNRRG